MEFYRDELVFKNTYNYEPKSKEVEIKNAKIGKNKHTGLKVGIAALILATFAPTCGRSLVHSIEKSKKEYELQERDKIYDNAIELLKSMRITNSIMLAKYISNLINDGYFKIDNKMLDTYTTITDEYDYNSFLGFDTQRGNSEIITKLENELLDNVDAYTVAIKMRDKTIDNEKKIITEYMTLIVDKDLKIAYLYWQGIDRFINFTSLSGFNNEFFSGNIDMIGEYVTGNLNIFDIVNLNGNMNEVFHEINFEIYKDKAEKFYQLTYDERYDSNRLNADSKFKIEYKEKTKRIAE